MRSRGKIFQGRVGCDWSAIRRSIKFGAGAEPTEKGTYTYGRAPIQTILNQNNPTLSTTNTFLILGPKSLFSNSFQRYLDLLHISCKMGASVMKSLRSYAASVIRAPVDKVDNDRFTVCWNCFVRNYKPHNGRCFNCGVQM